MGKELKKKVTIPDLLRERNDALAAWEKAILATEEAKRLFSRMQKNETPSRDEARKEIDRHFWFRAAEEAGFLDLMDQAERAKFLDEIENPAPFTADVVNATFERLFEKREEIFKRGLIGVFERLNTRYKSNSEFKLQKRTIFYYSPYTRYCVANDLERIVYMVSGRRAPEYADSLESHFRGATINQRTAEHETDLYRAKLHKNGQVHFWIKDQAVLDRVNKMLAEHYGPLIGGGKK